MLLENIQNFKLKYLSNKDVSVIKSEAKPSQASPLVLEGMDDKFQELKL